ncbi:MAG: tetratricopeptide repeat protein [Planctomycetota bacterium]
MWFSFVLAAVLAGSSAQDSADELYQYLKEGKVAEGVTKAAAFVQAHPDDPGGHHALGRLLYADGQHGKAIEHLQRCLELKPGAAWMVGWSHLVIGQCHAVLGHVDEAKAHLEKAIALKATANCTRAAEQALAALTGGQQEAPRSGVIGRALPPFTFWGLAGETYRAEEFKGKPLLLKFGPSW